MGHRTSIYLPDDVFEALSASGKTASAVLRSGLGLDPVDVKLARLAAQEAAQAVADDVRGIVRDEVRSALRDAQGGSW